MAAMTAAEAADLFRREPDSYLDVGAGEAAYRKVGSGPDVLFVHGWPVSGATFRKLLPHLVDHVTCHLIDLPSSGSSRFEANTPMSIAQHVASVRRVVDLLGVDEIGVVGHDSGGMIARHAVAGEGANSTAEPWLLQRAGEENRTPVPSLGSWCSTIELHPHSLP